MNIKKRQQKSILAVLLILLVFGCAPKVSIRASDSIFKENPIKEITVIAEGRVEWPRIGGKEAVLGLTDSKKAMEILLPKTKEVFSKKGYKVVFCEPVGIGYYSPGYTENWVVSSEENLNDIKEEEVKETGDNKSESESQLFKKKWQITDRKPAYEYPVVQNNQDFRKSVQNVFEQLELAVSQKQVDTFNPPKVDLEVIRKFTGGDTICLNRIYGQKYSTSRKVGAFMLGVAAGMFGVYGTPQPTDWIVSDFICVNAINGEVLWQAGLAGLFDCSDPTALPETFFDNILDYFPEANKPITAKCEKTEGSHYLCSK